LTRLDDALVANTFGNHAVWGDVVTFAACTAARIGGLRLPRERHQHHRLTGYGTVRRQTTPSPGGLVDKGTKGKAGPRRTPDPEIHELTLRRIASTDDDPDAGPTRTRRTVRTRR
jgi:hypothetical protein